MRTARATVPLINLTLLPLEGDGRGKGKERMEKGSMTKFVIIRVPERADEREVAPVTEKRRD